MRFSIRIGSLVIRQLMTADDAGATTGPDLIRINVCQAQLLYIGPFVNYNRYNIGDYFTNYTSTLRGSSLKWIASWPSEHYQNGWPSLRPSSSLISCPSRIGLGASPVLDFHL